MAKVATYPICSICNTFQGVYQEDLDKHLKDVHKHDPLHKDIDYKEGIKNVLTRTAELDNKEKDLAAWEKELAEKEALLGGNTKGTSETPSEKTSAENIKDAADIPEEPKAQTRSRR